MLSSNIIKEGDSVVLYFSITTVVLVPSIQPCGVTHNAWGYFSHEDIIGQQFGSKVHPRMNSENPRPVHVLRVTPELFTLSIPHRTQIIYHADISTIISGLNLLPGTIVAEAGTGSASLSYSIMNSIAPHGTLYTFDNDASRAEHNRELLKCVSEPGVVVVEQRDVIEFGFPLSLSVDAVFLDLPSPWQVIKHAKDILKENGRICTFSPAIEQVMKNVRALQSEGFHEIRTLEIMLKPWGLDLPKNPSIGDKRKLVSSCKPGSFQLPMRGHTSYLTFAIKSLSDEASHPKPVLSVGNVRRLIDINQ